MKTPSYLKDGVTIALGHSSQVILSNNPHGYTVLEIPIGTNRQESKELGQFITEAINEKIERDNQTKQ